MKILALHCHKFNALWNKKN